MKKTLLTILCAFFGLCAMAQNQKTYNEKYIVAVNEEPGEPKDGQIVIEDNADGTINFVVKDLMVTMGNSDVSLGDIRIEGCEVVELDGDRYFENEGEYTIPASSLPADMQFMAGFFKDIPYSLGGVMNDERLFATMEIHMTSLQQEIDVVIGDPSVFFSETEGMVYTEQLLVTINGNPTEPRMADVTVYYNPDGTVNFELKNFFFNLEGFEAPVGTIYVENIPAREGDDGLLYLEYDGSITIQDGDLEGIDTWVGPMLGPIDVSLRGKMSEDKLFVTIDMPNAMGQAVFVQLGTDNFGAEGKVYTEQLLVSINGQPTEPRMADVTVYDNSDGTVNFELKNFFFNLEGYEAPVGTIFVENIPAREGEDGLLYLEYDGSITIQNGDLEGVGTWVGPLLGPIDISLRGKMSEDKLFVTIDMPNAMGQAVFVQLGSDDFEQPVITWNYTEPYFVTAYGATPTPQTVDVVVYDKDETIDFELKDFVLNVGDVAIPFGNLTLHNLKTTKGENGMTYFGPEERTISVPADMLPAEFQIYAALLNNIPVTVEGKFNDKKLYAEIDTNVPVFNIEVHVQIGLSVGDVNCDGLIDIADAVTVLNAMAGQDVNGDADTNGDGVVDIADFVTVLNIMAGQVIE